ncbi:MAG: fumarylacetoacetate hydrolase family protein [Pseudomonadota bacterium]|nr:fumarylacetoacetate hydrolase family protein [Pseudomonadota bacterium]
MNQSRLADEYVVPLWAPPAIGVVRGALYPVRNIYCVGRNYAEHAREMGTDPDREPPFFFMKAADCVVSSGSKVDYPSRTCNLHHEVELVCAISVAGVDITVANAQEHIFGYAVGVDLTRRDLQQSMKEKGRPWEIGKCFAQAAPISELQPASKIGHPREGEIALSVNGEVRQKGDLRDMIWSVDEVVAELSTYYKLEPGDLIFTGTPAGVGPVVKGDDVQCSIANLKPLQFVIS